MKLKKWLSTCEDKIKSNAGDALTENCRAHLGYPTQEISLSSMELPFELVCFVWDEGL